ncbi:MAG: SET domain-containing protein [Bacteroidetes bacterium]|nr:SET domain-containing protein [Bacteroidota bacterium]
MALLEKNLIIKRSRIGGAGKGLFTKKFIPKGTRIVEYKGAANTWKNVDDKNGRNGYIFYINRNLVIDALRYKKALGRYANDARGLTKNKSLVNNCVYVVEHGKVFIESTRDIPAGAEILVDYGKDYWKAMRYNLKRDISH